MKLIKANAIKVKNQHGIKYCTLLLHSNLSHTTLVVGEINERKEYLISLSNKTLSLFKLYLENNKIKYRI